MGHELVGVCKHSAETVLHRCHTDLPLSSLQTLNSDPLLARLREGVQQSQPSPQSEEMQGECEVYSCRPAVRVGYLNLGC